MSRLVQFVSSTGMVLAMAAFVLVASDGLGHAESGLDWRCFGGLPVSVECEGERVDGFDVGTEWPGVETVNLRNVDITNAIGDDAVFNIDGQAVYLGKDGDSLVRQSSDGNEVAGVAATGFEEGAIVNYGRIEVGGTGDLTAGIRLGTSHFPVPHSANKTVENHGTIDVVGAEEVDGITAHGDGHSIANHGEITVEGSVATGIFAEADPGVDGHVEGQTVVISNAGSLDVRGGNVAVGVHTIGYQAGIESSGTIHITAEGGADSGTVVSAAGIQVEGDGSVATNNGEINVTAKEAAGPVHASGVAIGMAVFGADSRAENQGYLTVDAAGTDMAIAVGLASCPAEIEGLEPGTPAMDAGGNTLLNGRTVSVTAQGIDGSSPHLAGAAGMIGVGADSKLENSFGEFDIHASGTDAIGAGMVVLGDASTIANGGGRVWVTVEGDERAVALGLAAADIDLADGLRFTQAENVRLENGHQTEVRASADQALAAGMAVLGVDSSAESSGDIAGMMVEAIGDDMAVAVGMVAAPAEIDGLELGA